ncbi:MAG TPA: hypothetical protein PLW86_16315 [Rhodocyclaceae bacterium]|nr:hypothetical protein [Rhodocyclaceae bacterium]
MTVPAPEPLFPVLDIEASGFGAGSYPIEVGFVLPDATSYCTLIRPVERWVHWQAQAEAVHGITREILARYGKPPVDVAFQLNQSLHGMTLYTDCWSADWGWISRLFDEAELVPRFRLEDLRLLLTIDQANRWHAVKDAVVAELALNRHRASNDARVLQLTLQRVRTEQALAQPA